MPSARSGSIRRSIGSSAAVSAAIHRAPGTDPREQPRVGPDRERHQRRDQQEEGDRQPRCAARSRGARRGRISAPIIGQAPAAPVAGERLVRSGEHRAAAARDARRRRASSCSAPSASSPLSGSSSSHSGAPRRGDAGQRRALRLARRQQAHRHLGKARKAERFHRRVDVRRPRSASARRSGSSRSSARCVVGQRQRARARPCPRSARKQAGGKPDQARLAAAVGPGDVQRLAAARAAGRVLRTAAARRAAA